MFKYYKENIYYIYYILTTKYPKVELPIIEDIYKFILLISLKLHQFILSVTKIQSTYIYTCIINKLIMKNILLAFVLLFALSSQPLLGAADASPEQVVDTSGKKLRAGLSYYIVPAVPLTRCGRYERCMGGGGLSLASIGESCPLDVVVVPRSHGLPLQFSPVDPKKGVVRVSTDLNIMFSTDHTSCAEYSPVWKLDHFDVSKGKWFVSTGGSMGNPSWETIRNWFKIEKCDGAYKIVYCPSVFPSSSSKHMCKDIGVFVDENGFRRLALSNVPFKVKFQRA